MKKYFLFVLLIFLTISAYSQNINMSECTGFEDEFNLEDGDYYVNEIRLLSETCNLISPENKYTDYIIRAKDKRIYFLYNYNGNWFERKLSKFSNADFGGINEYEWLLDINSETVMSYLNKDGLFYYTSAERPMGHDFYCILKKENKVFLIFEVKQGDLEGPDTIETCVYIFDKKKTTPKIVSYNELQKSKTNVTVNKIMIVNENLRLRKAEITSSEIITTMQAGTKVKIIALGKHEVIDGISSNWVRVEVQSDAKDRNGNPIKAGTIGWCYGGYLK